MPRIVPLGSEFPLAGHLNTIAVVFRLRQHDGRIARSFACAGRSLTRAAPQRVRRWAAALNGDLRGNRVPCG